MVSLTFLALGAHVGTADPSGSNEHWALSSPEVGVVVEVAAEREENGEEGRQRVGE
jgi:hypothetical protein